ncbi:MAG: CopG family antitoxin [Hormoscilla sp.]
MNVPKIPNTDSIAELAKFWDTHDLTDFEDQLEEVTEPVFERRMVVKITFKPTEVEAVKEAASLRGIDYVDMMRECILSAVSTT